MTSPPTTGAGAASLGLLITEGTYVDQSAGSSQPGAEVLRRPGRWTAGGRSRRPCTTTAARSSRSSGTSARSAAPGQPALSRRARHQPVRPRPGGQRGRRTRHRGRARPVVASFARAAAEAKAAGFDGVELHGAHGYLLDQFHWPVTNRRTDRYGGDMAGRVAAQRRDRRRRPRRDRAAVPDRVPVLPVEGRRLQRPDRRGPGRARGLPHPAGRRRASRSSTPPSAATGCPRSTAPTARWPAGPGT